jgi:hypothetical protein
MAKPKLDLLEWRLDLLMLKTLAEGTENWKRLSAAIGHILQAT